MGLKRPSSTAHAMATIAGGYIDPYEPKPRRERAYMCSISLAYQDDNMDDVATVATTAMEDTIIV